MSEVVVRIPPSPTGNLHIGTARTALFNYIFAKKYGGKIILRYEDTDQERSTQAFEENIKVGLDWLGFAVDETHHQSKRTDVYTSYLTKLIESGNAYVSKEPAKSGEGEVEVVRFKNPNTSITFTDMVRGDITFDTTELGDFVIAKSMTEPLYHLAVVVDDFDMGITHVIRGEDHISNTPRQILIQEALGAPRPVYAHLPLILAPDKTKLSKRHGAVALTEYRDQGFLRDALINYLAMLGWNPGTDQEVFSLEELVDAFSLEQVQKGGAVFNIEKLRWFNKQYLEHVDDSVFVDEIQSRFKSVHVTEAMAQKLLPLMRERIELFSDITHMDEAGEFGYLFTAPAPHVEDLIWKDADQPETHEHLVHVQEKLSELEDFTIDAVKEAVWEYAELHGKGNVLWPMRYALTGQKKSPDPFTVAHLLGKNVTLERLKQAISRLT